MVENICLIGFMGSGKTTIGEALAQKIGWNWVDLDEAIATGEHTTIANIFAEKGEAYFRSLESKYLREALTHKKTIISTGGGIIVTPLNIEMLKQTTTFYLAWPFEVLYKRITGDLTRPLVTNYEEVFERFKNREASYHMASRQIISCEGKSIEEIVAEILQDGNDSLNEK